MAHTEKIKIPRASDKKIIDFFRRLGNEYGVPSVAISAIGAAQLGQVNLEAEPTGDLAQLLELDSELISALGLNLRGFSIAYHRSGQTEPKSPVFDEIVITSDPRQGDLSNSDKLKIVAAINSELQGTQPGRVVDSGLSQEQSDLLAIHQATLDRLEGLNEQLIKQTTEHRAELDRQYQSRLDELEQEHHRRAEKLDSEYQKKDTALADERAKLQARQKEIDDRDNTHVRRELRTALLEEVKARSAKFSLTRGTQRLRWPIHLACVAFFVLTSYFTYTYSSELFAYVQREVVHVVPTILLSLKSLGFTFAAVGTAVFYIRWLNQWLDQHAEAEFRLKQFQLDIDRASWVVETVLEMRAGQSVMPTALLDSITRNLFEYERRKQEEDLHPADQLASALLGTASNVKVKAGDAEITFAGKELKKQMKKQEEALE